MSLALLFSQLVSSVSDTTLLLGLVIILAAIVVEDASTLIVGMLVADGTIPFSIGLLSLYLGVFLGDICFYTIGYLARTHPKLDRYVDHAYIVPIRAWIKSRYALTLLSARFVPGTRFPTYMASGFFRAPLSTFLLVVGGGILVWTTTLFGLSYWLGSTEWLGHLRYGIAAIILVTLFFVGRHNLQSYRKELEAMSKPSSGRDVDILSP